MKHSIIRVADICKVYGSKPVLRDICFNADQGEIIGIIGPNGAGKTTLLRILATLIRPSAGKIFFGDQIPDNLEPRIREQIGYMPEETGYYLKLSGMQTLNYYKSFYRSVLSIGEITDMLKLLNLWTVRDTAVGKYSKGMKRTLLFIKTIIHKPLILLLDEPMTGMDPGTCKICCEILKTLAHEEKKCVLISSHSLNELEMICDRVFFLLDGRKVFDEKITTLTDNQMTSSYLDELYAALTKL